MPTEAAGRIKPTLHANGGSHAACDYPNSNGNHRPISPRNGSLKTQHDQTSNAMSISRSGGVPIATEESSIRPPVQRRVKDALNAYEQLAKQKNDGGPVSNGHKASTGSISPVADGSSNGAKIRREDKDLFEIPLANSHPIATSPYMPTSKDVPALNYMQHFSEIQEIQEEPIANLPVDKTRGSRRTVRENGHRRSTSTSKLDAPSTDIKEKSSPAKNRLHSQTFNKPSGSSRGSRTEQPEGGRLYPRSSSEISQQANKGRSRGGTNSKNLNEKLENTAPPRPSSTTHSRTHPTRASGSEGSGDSEFDLEEVGSKVTKARSTRKTLKADQPSHSAMKHEDASGDVHPGPLYKSQRENGLRSRLEDSHQSAASTKRRSESFKQANGSIVPVTRTESNKTLTPEEGSMNNSHTNGKQGGTGESVKEEKAPKSGLLKNDSKSEGSTSSSRRLDEAGDPPASRKLSEINQNVKVLLRGVAAALYNRGWLPFNEMVPFPEDISRLNQFLKNCNTEVEAGVPGRFLTVVLGKDTSDLDSVVSTIAYAYFLSCTGSEDQCFVPVINMRHEELVMHPEAVWLFEVTGIDASNLLFVDQISLQYYHRFGNLSLVLVDHSRLAPHQENLQDAVIEVVHHDSTEDAYPWVSTVDIQEVGSCCTVIAERFAAHAPQQLLGRGLSRLLLAPILLDTVNLDAKSSRCTTRDECMAAFLINGAGRYGQQGFFKLLRKMKYDVSGLTSRDVLRKDFKQWKLGPGKTDTNGCEGKVLYAAMSTVGVSLMEILKRRGILQDLKRFERKMKLDLHLVVTGYYDNSDRYKREILIIPEDRKLTEHLLACFSLHTQALKLSPINIGGLPDEMLVYRQGLVTASRRVLCQMLVDHFAK